MLTPLIKIYLGDDANFVSLVEDYGRWARYSGIGGYSTGHHRDGPKFIDDDSALVIDRAFGVIRKSHKRVYQVLEMYYIKRMDMLDIACFWNRSNHERGVQRHAIEQADGMYAVKQHGHRTRYGADADLVGDIIRFYTNRLREILKEFELQTV